MADAPFGASSSSETKVWSRGTEGNPAQVAPSPSYLNGWRLVITTICICCSIFLPNLEVTIVSTALVEIANDLNAFKKTSWMIVGYLITYTGFIIIWAKLSDIIGRKTALIVSLALFTVFSGGCGAAQTITQLIVLRAFQGLGGAGCFSVASVVMFEMIPKQKYPKFTIFISVVVALATLLGPILGGVITDKTTWRWVFIINVPIGAVTMILALIALPNGFPQHNPNIKQAKSIVSIREKLRRVDFLGAFLFLGASFLFVTALLEASSDFDWSSAPTITMLVLSGILAISFISWERYITIRQTTQEPIFPWRFCVNRACISELLVSLFLGVVLTVLVVTIPQKFQTIGDLSPLQSGLRLLAYALVSPFGAVVANTIISRIKGLPIVYVVIAGTCIQLIGLSLFCTYGATIHISGVQYGCQAIAGFGQGLAFGAVVVMTPLTVESRDLATASGAMIQFRQFGGAIGLSIATSILNTELKTKLPTILSPSDLERLIHNTRIIQEFSSPTKEKVQSVFVDAYALQLKVITGLAAINVIVALMIWKKSQIIVPIAKA